MVVEGGGRGEVEGWEERGRENESEKKREIQEKKRKMEKRKKR